MTHPILTQTKVNWKIQFWTPSAFWLPRMRCTCQIVFRLLNCLYAKNNRDYLLRDLYRCRGSLRVFVSSPRDQTIVFHSENAWIFIEQTATVVDMSSRLHCRRSSTGKLTFRNLANVMTMSFVKLATDAGIASESSRFSVNILHYYWKEKSGHYRPGRHFRGSVSLSRLL